MGIKISQTIKGREKVKSEKEIQFPITSDSPLITSLQSAAFPVGRPGPFSPSSLPSGPCRKDGPDTQFSLFLHLPRTPPGDSAQRGARGSRPARTSQRFPTRLQTRRLKGLCPLPALSPGAFHSTASPSFPMTLTTRQNMHFTLIIELYRLFGL